MIARTSLLSVLFIGLVQAESPSQARPVDAADAYGAYRALLPQEWTVRVAKAKTLVIQRETTTYPKCEPQPGRLEPGWREVLEDYRTENATPRWLRPDQQLGIPYVLVPAVDLRAFFAKPAANDLQLGWETFHQTYPDSGGYMDVSAVGFNAQRTRAMVYIGHHCGGLCGGGAHHFLTRAGDTWQEDREIGAQTCIWVS